MSVAPPAPCVEARGSTHASVCVKVCHRSFPPIVRHASWLTVTGLIVPLFLSAFVAQHTSPVGGAERGGGGGGRLLEEVWGWFQ